MANNYKRMNYLYECSNFTNTTESSKVVQVHMERTSKWSNESKERMKERLEVVKYGEGSNRYMCIAKPNNCTQDTSVTVYLHGGYWCQGRPEDYLYICEILADAGFIGIAMGYDKCPEVEMTEVMESACAGYKKISELFSNAKSLTLVGHSAGAHLVIEILSKSERNKFEQIKAILISGIYNIEGAMYTCHASDLRLTKKDCDSMNAFKNIKAIAPEKTKFVVATAEVESPAFTQQADDFHLALRSHSLFSTRIVVLDTDHFEIVEKILNPENILRKIILDDPQLTC